MKIRNKFILLGAVLFTTSFAYGEKSEALKSYTTENLSYTEMVEKEINDDIFMEFVDGDIVEEPSKNVEIYLFTNTLMVKFIITTLNYTCIWNW